MIWGIINIILLSFLAMSLLWQLYTVGKAKILDDVLLNFREMRYESAGILADRRISSGISNEYENWELSEFIKLTTHAIDNFDAIKAQAINFKTFKLLFLNIDNSLKASRRIDLETSELANKLRVRFVKNLYKAFTIIPFFRMRLIAKLSIFILQTLMDIGFLHMHNYMGKSKHIIQIYNSLDEQDKNLCF